MDRMSGDIGFESKPGEGTVFYVTLPRAGAQGWRSAVPKAYCPGLNPTQRRRERRESQCEKTLSFARET